MKNKSVSFSWLVGLSWPFTPGFAIDLACLKDLHDVPPIPKELDIFLRSRSDRACLHELANSPSTSLN